MNQKFIYLHGFNSGPDRSFDKVRLLESIGEVDLPGYDSFDTYDRNMDSLTGSIGIDIEENPVFIGTSLGGFYAAEMGKHFGRPCVMINPAWNPFDVLAPQCGQTFTNYKSGAVRTLARETVESYRGRCFDPERYHLPLVLLDDGDELLDSKATEAHFTGLKCPVVLFQGGSHRFEHMQDALPQILQYTNHCEFVADLNI